MWAPSGHCVDNPEPPAQAPEDRRYWAFYVLHYPMTLYAGVFIATVGVWVIVGAVLPKEWRALIRAELKGKGRNRYCTATCPICLISYNVDTSQ